MAGYKLLETLHFRYLNILVRLWDGARPYMHQEIDQNLGEGLMPKKLYY